jgi:hypothetical protein
MYNGLLVISELSLMIAFLAFPLNPIPQPVADPITPANLATMLLSTVVKGHSVKNISSVPLVVNGRFFTKSLKTLAETFNKAAYNTA